jgi:hypothetical protein
MYIEFVVGHGQRAFADADRQEDKTENAELRLELAMLWEFCFDTTPSRQTDR